MDLIVDLIMALASVKEIIPAELLVFLILGAIMAVYFFVAVAKNIKKPNQRNDIDEFQKEIWDGDIDVEIKSFFEAINGRQSDMFFEAFKDYLDKNNYALTKEAVSKFMYDQLSSYTKDEEVKYEYVYSKDGQEIMDAIFRSAQIGLKEGAEYEKLQKKIKSKLKDVKDIDLNSAEAKEYLKNSEAFKDLDFDMQNQMQMQMQMEMQNQIQLQMQMEMQNQMQMQMQMEMQNQMQMQMQMEMEQQIHMQMDNMNIPTGIPDMSNMAITSTDAGGFMDHNANSGNFM